MAIVISRTTLIEYALRRLGEPVIEINVDEDQLEDRVDEALQYYQEYNSDATKRVYLKHEVTAADVTNRYIEVNTNVLFVRRVLPMNSGLQGGGGFMNVKYQMMLNDFATVMSMAGNMAYYHQMKMHLELIDSHLSGLPQTDFVQNEGRIYFHGEFESGDIKEGQFLVVEALQLVDPETHTSTYNDMFMKEYTTALIKQQWGANLIKFEGMQLPGGVTLNGRQIYDDATTEVQKLREDLRLEHELPVDFIIG